ncbi:ATPase [Flavobacterium sp. IR1]|nr:ATPase [Flavobacterium sp. IR1]
MKTKNEYFYVITGGPGVGKTTLIEKLSDYGFQIVHEDARRIIKEQIETNNEGLPWKQKDLFAQLMLEASLKSYNETSSKNGSEITFFDRGILDTICYMKMEQLPLSKEIIALATQHSYNKNVFILPPWKEIYQTDKERKQNWEEAEFTFDIMKETYLEYDYNIIEVPKINIAERVKFIIERISKLSK